MARVLRGRGQVLLAAVERAEKNDQAAIVSLRQSFSDFNAVLAGDSQHIAALSGRAEAYLDLSAMAIKRGNLTSANNTVALALADLDAILAIDPNHPVAVKTQKAALGTLVHLRSMQFSAAG
jgi:hypothetical protein